MKNKPLPELPKLTSEHIKTPKQTKQVIESTIGENKQTGKRDYVAEMGVVEKLIHKDKEKILIKMFLRNGNNTEFYVSPKKNFFNFREGAYLIIQDYLVFDEGAESYFAFYHEDCCLPFRVDVTITDFYSAVEGSDNATNKVAQALNPSNLARFQKSTLVEQTMSGSKLESQQQMQLFISIAMIIINMFILVIVIYNTGAFS